MNNSKNDESRDVRADALGRRDFLTKTALAGAALALSSAPTAASQHQATSSSAGSPTPKLSGQRKLASLEVSSVGLGVQNMSRTYQTTVPRRPEMINIIRTAFDRGVTFFGNRPNDSQPLGLNCQAGELPKGLNHDCYNHRFYPVQQTFCLRQFSDFT